MKLFYLIQLDYENIVSFFGVCVFSSWYVVASGRIAKSYFLLQRHTLDSYHSSVSSDYYVCFRFERVDFTKQVSTK